MGIALVKFSVVCRRVPPLWFVFLSLPDRNGDMPYRFFNVDEAAQYLDLARVDLDRLIKDQNIPFEKRGDRLVFRRRDLDAWASQRILSANPKRLAEYHRRSSERVEADQQRTAILPELVRPEQIDPAMTAKTKPSLLRDIVALATRTGWVCDPAELIESLGTREELCSTAVPGGLAFLHPRAQQPYRFEASFLVLGRTVQPIHFGAPDGQPTDLFFLLCFKDDTLHLHALARLCLISLKTDFLSDLRAAQDAVAMHQALLAAEEIVQESLRTVPAA
jgi:nitrogen PTS system EIIA component